MIEIWAYFGMGRDVVFMYGRSYLLTINRFLIRNYYSSTRIFEKIDGQSVYYSKVGHGPNNIICLPGPFGSAIMDFQSMFHLIDPNK
ncbi:hypothetical protein Ciccas_003274 [Cichlidogyrus casuarinus]|uniref:Uncharacterized protein n=1 Tax=Cichlidogyrus casuarinus TaxID=1844966 RepID=A0ABD2QET8_9PLAT